MSDTYLNDDEQNRESLQTIASCLVRIAEGIDRLSDQFEEFKTIQVDQLKRWNALNAMEETKQEVAR